MIAVSPILIAFLSFLTLANLFLLTRRWFTAAFGLFFLVDLFISQEMVGLISGTPFSAPGVVNLSMAAYDVMIMAVILLVLRPGNVNHIYRQEYIILSVCFTVMIAVRLLVDGMGVFSNKLFDNFLCPVLLCFLIMKYLEPKEVPRLLWIVFFCILINAVLAIAEYFIGKSLFFHEYYMELIPWYRGFYISTFYGVPFRSVALLGHPLVNGIYYLVGAVYVYQMKMHLVWKGIFLAILTFAIYTTNSRSVLLLFLLFSLFWLTQKRRLPFFFLALMAIIVIVQNLNLVDLYSQIFVRDKTGSSFMARINALRTITRLPLRHLLIGVGYNNTASVLRPFIDSNLENAYLIVLLENGIFGFIGWLVLWIKTFHFRMVKKLNGFPAQCTLASMTVAFLFESTMFNSFADPGTLNYILWSLAALSFVTSIPNMKYHSMNRRYQYHAGRVVSFCDTMGKGERDKDADEPNLGETG